MITKQNGTIREVSQVKLKHDGYLREAYIIMAKVNGVLRVVWELIRGYIFTSSGNSLQTNQGSIIKCNNQ